MEPAKARALALRLMDEHKVPKKWEFKFDRSRFRFGQAREAVVRGKKVYQITLSKHLVEVSSEAAVKDTILHEIAHVLVGLDHMHDAKWRAKAKQLGCSLEYSDRDVKAQMLVAPYRYKCHDCDEFVMVSHKPVGVEHLRCPTHPSATIERVRANGPEVHVSVV